MEDSDDEINNELMPIEIIDTSDEYLNEIMDHREKYGCILLLHMTNCRYCIDFIKNTWNDLIQDYSSDVQFFEIERNNIEKNPTVFKKVKGYPTIYIYSLKDNKNIEYKGSRDYDSLLAFMRLHINVPDNIK